MFRAFVFVSVVNGNKYTEYRQEGLSPSIQVHPNNKTTNGMTPSNPALMIIKYETAKFIYKTFIVWESNQ
jgi:hypothetical protein